MPRIDADALVQALHELGVVELRTPEVLQRVQQNRLVVLVLGERARRSGDEHRTATVPPFAGILRDRDPIRPAEPYGRKALSAGVIRAWRGASAGRAKNPLDRLQLRRALTAARGARDGHVVEFDAVEHAPQHQSAAAHVATADERGREHEPVAKNRLQYFDVLT